MTELLESEGARAMLDVGEERGWIEPAELEAFALENDLQELDVEELTRELERIGLEVREAVPDEKAAAKAAQEQVVWEADQPSGAGDSLQLFLADVGRHKLLTAAEEVTLAKAIERGDRSTLEAVQLRECQGLGNSPGAIELCRQQVELEAHSLAQDTRFEADQTINNLRDLFAGLNITSDLRNHPGDYYVFVRFLDGAGNASTNVIKSDKITLAAGYDIPTVRLPIQVR